MNTGDRIKARRTQLGFTLLEVANKLGVREATMQRYESGAIKNLKYDKMIKLAEILQTTPATLIGWNTQSTDKKTEYLNSIKNALPLVKQRIPLLGEVSCGIPLESCTYDDYVTIITNKKIDCDFALKANGDSMINARIEHGDIIFVKKVSDFNNGDIVVVNVNNEQTLKRIFRIKNGIMLQAENPKIPPLFFTGEDSFTEVVLIGKVVMGQYFL